MRSKKLSILLVDDNRHYLDRMSDMLSEMDAIGTIDIAENYEQASRMLDSEKPDLVLLDIHLPDNSGINLLRSIKASSMDCEVIMVSNCEAEYYRRKCKKLGARHFLDKSEGFDKMPSLLEELM